MPEQIRAITICQPWAWAIIAGHKRFENRTWRTEYTGPLVIHSSKSDGWMLQGMQFLRKLKITPLRAELEFGKVLGVVDLVDCVRPAEAGGDPFASGPYCFKLANPRRLTVPVAMRGMQGIYSMEASIVAELLGVAMADDAHPAETREQRLDRVAETVGRDRIHRIDQPQLW